MSRVGHVRSWRHGRVEEPLAGRDRATAFENGAVVDGTLAGREWHAETYVKGQGLEPLRCERCPTPVTHQAAHTRERDDRSIYVPAYFRLLPDGMHASNCKYAVAEGVKTIAKESKDLLESLSDGRYRLRLVMVKEALSNSRSAGSGKVSSTGSTSNPKARAASSNKLAEYISSAKRVLQLRALCDDDKEIAENLELVFEGNTIVTWPDFYVETERHHEAYIAVLQNSTQHPIALHGTVKSKRTFATGKSVINLVKQRNAPDPEDATHGIGLEVSVWSNNSKWLDGIAEDYDVVILGLWKASPGESELSKDHEKYRYKRFTTHKLSVNLVLGSQITKVPRR